ncbi:30S ribosomal protein S2 [archaeon]|nr:30S ribosomal protein S2 [archaeon]|tara:strand:+ start:4476 stop:5066 length:591 start_codon:yes stop_codon:yes gene_type:complete
MAEQEQLLVPLDDYLKVGIHIGTKFRTKYMEQFIYKVRSDGLSVLNVKSIDSRLGNAVNLISQFEPEDILLVCRRENGWKAAKAFSKATGIRVFAGRYPPGILTNTNLENFFETKLLMVVDPWSEKNAIRDAIKVGVPVLALCDTNNESNNLDLVIPCNNKGKKSLGLIFWILARDYLKNKKKDFKSKIEDFTDEE